MDGCMTGWRIGGMGDGVMDGGQWRDGQMTEKMNGWIMHGRWWPCGWNG